jgi:hypothetical protein
MRKWSWCFWRQSANIRLWRLRKTSKSGFAEFGECFAACETNKPPKSWSTQWSCSDTLRACSCKIAGKLKWGGTCVGPLGLDFGTRWRWGVSFRHRPLYVLGKSPCIHWTGVRIDLRVGLDSVKKKQTMSSPGVKLLFLGRPAHSVVAIVAMLPGSSERLYTRLYSH